MALVATVGASNSNSYVTRLEADTYFQLANHPEAETWHKLEDEDKDGYLIKATTIIDSQKIRGGKYDTLATSGVPDQRLKFPRAQDYDDSSEFIPFSVKIATYEQAVYMAKASGSTRAELQAQGVTSVSIGDVSESYDTGKPSTAMGQLAPLVKSILLQGGFLRRGGTIA